MSSHVRSLICFTAFVSGILFIFGYNSTYGFCYCYTIKAEPRINISLLRPILKLFISLISNEASGAKSESIWEAAEQGKKKINNAQKYSFYFFTWQFHKYRMKPLFFSQVLETRRLFVMYVMVIIIPFQLSAGIKLGKLCEWSHNLGETLVTYSVQCEYHLPRLSTVAAECDNFLHHLHNI